MCRSFCFPLSTQKVQIKKEMRSKATNYHHIEKLSLIHISNIIQNSKLLNDTHIFITYRTALWFFFWYPPLYNIQSSTVIHYMMPHLLQNSTVIHFKMPTSFILYRQDSGSLYDAHLFITQRTAFVINFYDTQLFIIYRAALWFIFCHTCPRS